MATVVADSLDFPAQSKGPIASDAWLAQNFELVAKYWMKRQVDERRNDKGYYPPDIVVHDYSVSPHRAVWIVFQHLDILDCNKNGTWEKSVFSYEFFYFNTQHPCPRLIGSRTVVHRRQPGVFDNMAVAKNDIYDISLRDGEIKIRGRYTYGKELILPLP